MKSERDYCGLHNRARSSRGLGVKRILALIAVVGAATFTLTAFTLASNRELAIRNTPRSEQSNSTKQVVTFNGHIRPILTQHCTACHGGVKQAAGLSFVYANDLANVVESGDASRSLLIERITESDEDLRMPPPEHGRALTTDEVDLLRKWIEQGANWQSHWAYQLPQSHPRPELHQVNWPRQPLDAFVLARLESLEIEPSADEHPHRWLRRVFLDLIGLPPTLEEQTRFLKNLQEQGEPAYSLVVDELLASPHFGERWASVWFDQVRYADSRGLGIDGQRTIWKYRDFVIKAFNEDLPYDEFTRKQIAGDLLAKPTIEDRIATAVHRLTQSNEEGGTDDEEFRIAAVVDRVNTVWQAWLGTSFGCTQCHDHPYDPFAHEEYYEFMALFNNTQDSDLNDDWPLLSVPKNHDDYAKAGEIEREIRKLKHAVWQLEFSEAVEKPTWQPVGNTAVHSPQVAMRVESRGERHEYRTVGTVPMGLEYRLEILLEETIPQLSGVRLTARPLVPEKALSDSEWGFVLSSMQAELNIPGEEKPQPIKFARVVGDDPAPRYDPNKSLDSKSGKGFSAFSRIHHPRTVVFILPEPLEIKSGTRLSLILKHYMNSGGSHPLVIKRGDVALSSDKRIVDLLSNEELLATEKQLEELRNQRNKIASTTVPVMQERVKHLARPSHVFERGLFLTKGEVVHPDIPDSLNVSKQPIRNRLDLANWMTSPKNPLVARVAVNRFWSRLFGKGIVETEEDFGSTGEAPTHQRLLDDLAVRFREDYQWRVKPLLRELVLSRTYRQSGARQQELEEKDPDNRLLARGPRLPLSAEIVRDQALAVSGLLDETMFGPPVKPPIQAGIWLPFQGGDKWPNTERGDPQRYRRSIYTYIKRSIPYPMFATFDAPSREFCVSRRLRSNTALQPLVTLNNETFVECAEKLAQNLLEQEGTVAEKIENGFQKALGRPPDSSELATLKNLYEVILARKNQLSAMTAVTTALFNFGEFLNH